jgi:NADH-quinone oxidoreductase subunit H
MSNWTPLAIVGVALAGAAIVAMLEQVVTEGRWQPAALAGSAARTLRQPLSRPQSYDSWLFHLAPVLLTVAAFSTLAFVPWSPDFRGIDMSAGLIGFAAALAYVTPAIFMAGWGTGRPAGVLGGFRWIALMLAYAMPLAMVATAVAAPAGSLRPVDIVEVQHSVPMAIVQPLALALWLPAVLAVCFLPPFDLPQADGELGGGTFSEYRGLDAALIVLSQKVLLVAVSGMTVVLFFAGWKGPLLPPALWMGLKTTAVAAAMLWFGTQIPRLQTDRVLSIAWKVANPLALLAIVISGLLTLVFYR